jgi:hypothetical protein
VISLIHPSRSRPEKSFQTIQKWIANAGVDIEVIVSLDFDDPNFNDYLKIYGSQVIVNKNGSAVDAINNAAKVGKGEILIVVSDDSDCPSNWGSKILKASQGRTDWIMKINDGIQRWIITMPIMDRAYFNRFGYIYYPEYKHMFCDTELTHVADVLKRTIKREDIFFPHRHYSVTKQRPDEVSKQADATWEQGKQLYLNRVRESFGLKNVDVMNISDNSHLRWLRQNMPRI